MQTSFYNKKLTQTLISSTQRCRSLLNELRYDDLISSINHAIRELPKIDDDVWSTLTPDQVDSCGGALDSLTQYLCEAHLKTRKMGCEPHEIESLLTIQGILSALIDRCIVFSRKQHFSNIKTSLTSWSRDDEKVLLARLGIDLRRHTRFFHSILHPEGLMELKLKDPKNAPLIGKKLSQIITESGDTDALHAIQLLIKRELNAVFDKIAAAGHLEISQIPQYQHAVKAIKATQSPDLYIAFSHSLAHHMQPPNPSIRLEDLPKVINASQFLANFWSYAKQIQNEISSAKDWRIERLALLTFRGIPENDKPWLEEGRRLLIQFAESNKAAPLPPMELFHLVHSCEAYENALQLKQDLGPVSEFMIWRSVLEKMGLAEPLRFPREIYHRVDHFMLLFKNSLQF